MTMRSVASTLAGCLLCMLATCPLAAEKEEGFYIGGSFGAARMDTSTSERDLANQLRAFGFTSADVQFDDRSSAFKVLAGYRVNRNFAVEGYFADLGKYNLSVSTTGPATAGSGDLKARGLGFDAVGIMPLSGRLSGLGRVGIIFWESKGNFEGESSSDDGSELKIGIGLEWKLNSNVSLRGEFEYYNFEEALGVLSVGLLYRFD